MTLTDVERETGWEKRGDSWLPPAPSKPHAHPQGDINLDGIWDPGDIKWSARVNAAAGWLKCDGSLKAKTAYPRLFEAIGFAYSPVPGTDPGGGNFYLPPPGRMPVGLDPTQVEFDTLGERGGSKTSTAPHTHALEGHVHGFATDHRNTNHAHNVYGRDFWVGTMNVNWTHNHGGSYIGNIHWNATQTHGHHDRPGVAAEAPWEGANWAGTVPLNIVGNDINHQHNANHDHPSTNYASESPWPGDYNHQHAGTTYDVGGPTGAQGSSAGATSGNLPPYVVFNCFIKI